MAWLLVLLAARRIIVGPQLPESFRASVLVIKRLLLRHFYYPLKYQNIYYKKGVKNALLQGIAVDLISLLLMHSNIILNKVMIPLLGTKIDHLFSDFFMVITIA